MRKSYPIPFHFIIPIIFVFSIQMIFGQYKFEVTYGGSDWERASIFNLTNDGGFIICGSSTSFSSNEDMYLLKITKNSDIEWSKVYRYSGYNSKLHGAKQTADGNYYLCGYIEGGFGFLDDIIIKIDSIGNIIWSKIFGGVEADELRDAFPTSDGGVLVTGQNASFGAGAKEIQAIKFSNDGNIEWAKAYGNIWEEFGASIQKLDNGDFVFLGAADISGSYDVRPLLVKVSSNGDLIWSKVYPGFIEDWGRYGIKTTDHGFLIVGDTRTYGLGGSKDIYVIKTDSLGNVQWAKAFGGIGSESGYGAVQSNDGKFVVSGFTNSFGSGGYDAFLMKIDTDGTLDWFYTYGGADNDYAFKLHRTNDDGFALTGSRSSESLGDEDIFLIKTDSEGLTNCQSGPFNINVFNINNLQAVDYNLFTSNVISVNDINLTAVTINSARNFICGEIPVELTSFTIDKTKQGVLLHWTTASELNNQGFEIQRATLNDDFFTIAFIQGNGTTTLNHEYSYLDELEYTGSELFRYRLKQIDFDGSFDYSEVIEIDFDVPKDFILFQNYPNPFNPSTTIRYAIPKYSPVKIIIYDLTGQIVKVLVDEVKQPGTYFTTFDTDELSSGVYIYQILAGDYFSVKKMNLLK